MTRKTARVSEPGRGWGEGVRPVLVAAFTLLVCVAGIAYADPQSSPVPPVVPSTGAGFVTLAAFTLPPTFYVGDRVELRIRLRVTNGVNIRAPAQMPTDKWVRIDSISITQAKGYSVVHVFFDSFAPGERQFPPIDLGGITISGIRVTTASLVSEGHTRLTEPKGQLALPGTTLILAIAVALLIGLPLAFFIMYKRFRYSFTAYLEKRRARRPWRRLSRALDALAAEKPPINPRRFYITLGDELRRYLTLKFGADFRAVTARELAAAARSAAVEDEAAEGLSAVMGFGDLVKFAGADADEDILQRDLLRVREIVGGIEETAERELRMRQMQAGSSSRTRVAAEAGPARAGRRGGS